MRRSFRVLRYVLIALILFASFVFLNNTSIFSYAREGKPTLLAHRGVAQRFDSQGITNDTCTAQRLIPSDHSYIENTIASIQASFSAGADIVELDIQPTTDGELAVFHDWTLECRTDGAGRTRDHSMAELRRLDVGYGYTADGGKTYPLRGKGVGLMPSLREVLKQFSDKRFVINVKGRDIAEGNLLAAHLSELSERQRSLLIVYGSGSELIDRVKAQVPDIRIMSGRTLKGCLQDYILWGWTGVIPEVCRGNAMLIPINIAPWLWGWPNKLLDRFENADTPVFITGPYYGGGFSVGMDTADDLARLPDNFTGGIWTNEVTQIARALKRSANAD